MIDVIYWARRARRRWARVRDQILDDLPAPGRRFAIFVPAWDESAVIGAMLRTTLANLPDPRLTIYVGAYPNDWATIEAIAAVAEQDRRVRLVIGPRAGPTTKADCLNALWRALCDDEEIAGSRVDAVILHDAEDVAHPGELAVFADRLRGADAVQLPVLPLPRRGAHLVGGTYLDEFSEAHLKSLVVREAVGAGLPLAGTGCAIARPMLAGIAARRGGAPFDAVSLTEDYELGLTIAALGGRMTIAHVAERDGGLPVAVRAYFPATLPDAVRQKTRWLVGIALAGWDRTGWAGWRRLGDHWMRMRDRRAPLSLLVLVAAYGSLALWAAAFAGQALGGPAPRLPDGWFAAILVANGVLLFWRLAMRAWFTGRIYGKAEALRSVPRMIVGNIVAMMAARRALFRYAAMLRGAPTRWDKTAHQFPEVAEVVR